MILGLALEKATGKKMADLLEERSRSARLEKYQAEPHRGDSRTGAACVQLRAPVYFNIRSYFNIPADQAFYEEPTGWNPSWMINHGAIQASNIADLHASAIAIGSGKLLSQQSMPI